MGEREEELKSLSVKVKRRVEGWLKTQHSKIKDHGIWPHQFMANRWGEKWEVKHFIFLGSKITVVGDCCYGIQRLLLLGKKL